MNYAEESLKKHYEWQGKIEGVSRVPVPTKDDLSLAFVDDSETGLGTTVCGIGVVKQSVSGRDGRLASSQIDEADGLTERDVPAAVCQRLLDGEVVELGIAAFQALVIEGKEGVT